MNIVVINLRILSCEIWDEEHVLLSYNESLTVYMFKKGARNNRSNPHGFSLVLIASKDLVLTVL